MGSLPLRPGGEVRSPARLAHSSADHLVNTLRRQRRRPDDDGRPVHRLGIVAEGRFEPTGRLASFSRTELLTVGSSSATVRFSTFSRDDWEWKPDIRGMACRLHDGQGDGPALDLVAMTAPRFIVRREEDFLALPARPTTWLRFLASRRTTLTAAATLLRSSTSIPLVSAPVRHLAAERYFGVHTFWLEKAGSYRAMRYHWAPVQPKRLPRQPLDHGLVAMLGPGRQLAFNLLIDLFDPDPPIHRLHDPLRRWPTMEREWPLIRSRSRWRGMTRVEAGRLTVTGLVGMDHPATDWVFNPVPAIGGFEASDDEILQARGAAYIASHVRRCSP